LLISFLVTLMSASAFAHAYLQKTDPPAGSTLAHAPDLVHFYFSEDVDAQFTQMTFFDSNGHKLADLPLIHRSPLQIDAPLPSIKEGTYTIAWRILSAVDGHTTVGTFPFRVGQKTSSCLDIPPLPANSEPSPIPWGRVTLHWLGFLALAGLIGAFFFQALVIQPSLVGTAFPAEHWASVTVVRSQRLLWFFWSLFVITSLLDLLAQAMSLNESSYIQLMQGNGILNLLQTRFGLVWLARLGLMLILGLLLVFRVHQRPLGSWVVSILGALIVFMISLSSHNAALKEQTGLAIFSDWVHLMTAAIWIGGLLQLVSIVVPAWRLVPESSRYRLIAQTVPRFSSIALASVIALIATGIYSAFRHVSSLEALFLTTYGRTIAIKHVLLIFLLGLASVHFLDIVPRLRRLANWIAEATSEQTQSLIRRFHGLVQIEIALVIGVLFFAGLLTLVPTAARPLAPSMAESAGLLRFVGESRGLQISLTLCSNRVGENEFDVFVIDSRTRLPVSDAQQVQLGFTHLGQDFGGLHTLTTPQGNGHYRTQGSYMNLTGKWEIEVTIRRADQAEDASVTFSLVISNRGRPQ
jgi:copper transport protein